MNLTDIDGIEFDTDIQSFTYYHVLFDEHEVMFANGAPTESLLLGDEALKTLPQSSLDELELLFPDLMTATAKYPSD